MGCRSAERLFSQYLDGELLDADERRLLAHVAVCDACRSLFHAYRRVDGVLMVRRPTIDLDATFTSATMAVLPPTMATRLPNDRSLAVAVLGYLLIAWSAIAFFAADRRTMLGDVVGDAGQMATIVMQAFSTIAEYGNASVADGLSAITTAAGAVLFLDACAIVALYGVLRRNRHAAP